MDEQEDPRKHTVGREQEVGELILKQMNSIHRSWSKYPRTTPACIQSSLFLLEMKTDSTLVRVYVWEVTFGSADWAFGPNKPFPLMGQVLKKSIFSLFWEKVTHLNNGERPTVDTTNWPLLVLSSIPSIASPSNCRRVLQLFLKHLQGFFFFKDKCITRAANRLGEKCLAPLIHSLSHKPRKVC